MPEQVERIVTLVSPEEHRQFKVACAKAGVTMTALIREWVLRWLRKRESSDARSHQ